MRDRVRRHLDGFPPRPPLVAGAARRRQPGPQRRVARTVLAAGDLVTQLPERPEALGDDVVLMDRLEVLLSRGDEAAAVQLWKLAHDAGDHLAHAILDEARTTVRLFDDLDLV